MKFLDITGLEKLWQKIRDNFVKKEEIAMHNTFFANIETALTNLNSKIPTKTSQLTNDSGFLTSHQSLSNYYTKTQVDTAISTAINNITDGDEVSY